MTDAGVDAPVDAGIDGIAVTVFASSDEASVRGALEIASLIRERQDAGRPAVLGLATGSTPKRLYAELVRMHEEEGLSFANVVVFNLDEYWPMERDARQCYRRYLGAQLLDHVDIDPKSVHLVDGAVSIQDVRATCEQYEALIREAGGIDLQVLGIGRSGHIGFNEPGSGRETRTRLITLDKSTRLDAASDFFGEWNVPRNAVTMGVGTILEARRILLLAFGEHKASIVQRALEGEVTPALAASFLREHRDVEFLLDPQAAAELTRFKTPWRKPEVCGSIVWDSVMTKRAVVWLAREVDKAILKLTDEDYKDHDLGDLLAARGSAYDLNIEVFKSLQRTINGWPGGKPGRPREDGAPDVVPKRVVVFSPHPDDDVISMGGTLIRLCDQAHEVHVAYQTSGNIAVWDDDAVRHADFVAEACRAFGLQHDAAKAEQLLRGVREFVDGKEPGQSDIESLRKLKGLIRRTEARAAAADSGVSLDRIHFLDLPFYETGKVKKNAVGEDDYAILIELLDRVRPHQIYAAGDLADPHGTHRVCLNAILEVLRRLHDRDWMVDCDVWLYRGAWQEWEPHEIEMAVPLSPDEVLRKRMAIFKHESQKDRALFPGSDQREFWQRAEARNRATAELYDRLGLPEYQAIEGFVRWRNFGQSDSARS